MFLAQFPPVVAVLLLIGLVDVFEEHAARLFILKQQFVDFGGIALASMLFD